MRRIGPDFETLIDTPQMLALRHRGSLANAAQPILFVVLAAVLWAFGLEAAAIFNFGLAALLMLAALANALHAWDLELDFVARRYQVRRGWRFRQRRIDGGFTDLSRLVAAVSGEGMWRLHLVPAGSERGYELRAGADRQAIEAAGNALAERLGVPFAVVAPRRESTASGPADLRNPPPGSAIKVRADAGGVELDLTPRPLLWRQWVKVGAKGIEAGTEPRLFGRRRAASTRVAWKDVIQIIVVASGDADADGARGLRRLRPDWREDRARLWEWHCAELRRPLAPLPWYGMLWYFWEGFPMESEKEVQIYRKRGPRLELGSSLRLGLPTIEWLARGLAQEARQRGVRLEESGD